MNNERRNLTSLDVARALEVPMSMVDGRPWVPTEAEADGGDEDEDGP